MFPPFNFHMQSFPIPTPKPQFTDLIQNTDLTSWFKWCSSCFVEIWFLSDTVELDGISILVLQVALKFISQKSWPSHKRPCSERFHEDAEWLWFKWRSLNCKMGNEVTAMNPFLMSSQMYFWCFEHNKRSAKWVHYIGKKDDVSKNDQPNQANCIHSVLISPHVSSSFHNICSFLIPHLSFVLTHFNVLMPATADSGGIMCLGCLSNCLSCSCKYNMSYLDGFSLLQLDTHYWF